MFGAQKQKEARPVSLRVVIYPLIAVSFMLVYFWIKWNDMLEESKNPVAAETLPTASAVEPAVVAPPAPTPEERAATAKRHLESAKAAIKKGNAVKDPIAALPYYEEANHEIQLASDGVGPEEVGKVSVVLAKARARSDCAASKFARTAAVEDVLRPKFYEAGLDISAKVSGKCGETITLKYVLWTDLTVYQYDKTGQIDELGRAGFKTVKLEGWDQTWTYTF